MDRPFRRLCLVLVLLLPLPSLALAERVIIRTAKPYDAVAQKITALGGRILYEFRNANGLAADLPGNQVDSLKTIAGVQYYVRDVDVPNPRPAETLSLSAASPASLGAQAIPANYFPYTSDLTGASALQNAGFLGQGVVVGMIDTGISASVPAVAGRVLGGENFVPGATEPDANSPLNDPHGTWTACMVGADVAFLFSHTSAFATAVRTYCTPAASSPCSFDAGGGLDAIPMVGQAPAVQFFALKVFAAAGGGAPTSRVLQAMDRAIELKNSTLPNMRVVNMSLGGTTLFAGGDIENELASSMAASGISLVVSAGNAGPSGSTVSSPGTAENILTVGAASSPVHERILRDLQFGAGIGPLWRPDNNQQIASFSSRGPDADGRNDPEVVANGFASYAQGADGGISLVSGTSFAAPTVAGVVADLYSANPSATPSKIRAAIVRAANSAMVPSAHREDQGTGYVNGGGANALLASFVFPVPDFGLGSPSVAVNVLLDGIIPIIVPNFSAHISNLRPAERKEFYFLVDPTTDVVRVTLTHVSPSLPPAQQNALFGDDLLFAVHSAKTSAIGASGDYKAEVFVASDQTFTFQNLDSGLMRITLNGDSTNAGSISTDVTIEETHAPLSKKDFHGSLAQGDEAVHTVTIAPGTASATFRLSWQDDWAAYPTDDLDMILEAPDGTFVFSGATLNSPERATIANPQPGTWTIFVDAFTVFGKKEKYEVRVD